MYNKLNYISTYDFDIRFKSIQDFSPTFFIFKKNIDTKNWEVCACLGTNELLFYCQSMKKIKKELKNKLKQLMN